MNKKSWSFKLVLAGVCIIALALSLVACSGSNVTAVGSPSTVDSTTASMPKSVPPTAVTPKITDLTVNIPLDVVQTKYNADFKLLLDKGTEYFMAYIYNGKPQIRASICVPCRSVSFTLVKNTLVCDTSGTVFSAVDGSGISGACVSYPKASVPFETVNGKLVMTKADLIKAFEQTLSPGLP